MFHEDWYPAAQCQHLTRLCRETAHLSGLVVDVGVWEGRSTIALAKACAPHPVHAVDTWQGNLAETPDHPTVRLLRERDVEAEFHTNVREQTAGNVIVYRMDCLAYLRAVPRGEALRLIHIDASHDYDTVVETIRLARPLMQSGGVCCGDDYFNAPGVSKAVRECFGRAHQVFDNLWIMQL